MGRANRILCPPIFCRPARRIDFCGVSPHPLENLLFAQRARSLRAFGSVVDSLSSLDGVRNLKFILILNLGILASRRGIRSVNILRVQQLPTVSGAFPPCGHHRSFIVVHSLIADRPCQSPRPLN